MRILHSRRCCYAFALLLTFAAWLAGCWWAMPYRPRYSYAIHRGAYIEEISPDDQKLLLGTSLSSEYYDIANGSRIEDPSSVELRRLRQLSWCRDRFKWNAALGENCISLRESLFPDSEKRFVLQSYDRERGLPLECVGSNDHSYAYSLKGETPFHWNGSKRPDRVVVTDLATERPTAILHGTCFPIAISPNGQTALTITANPIDGKYDPQLPEFRLVLWDLQTASRVSELGSLEGDYRDVEFKYSANGEYVIELARRRRGNSATWWDATGRVVGTAPETPEPASQVLADSDRLLVRFYETANQLNCEFWDFERGQRLGEWHRAVDSLSGRSIILSGMIGSREGPWIGLLYPRDKEKSGSRIWSRFNKFFSTPSAPQPINDDVELIILDAMKQKEVARLPTRYAQFSRDGRVLVTQDNHENFAVYDLPLRKPWARIFGFAAGATLGCALLFAACRRLLRRRRAT
jgi:hypothetical protein